MDRMPAGCASTEHTRFGGTQAEWQGTLVYAIIRFAEAYGLWRARAWAEWFALISGTIYVPFEIHALFHHPNPIKWAILFINIAIVLYMARLRMEAVRARERRVGLAEAVKDSFIE